MSVFYCNDCDRLMDSDETLFIVDDETGFWTCEICLENNPDIDAEKVLHKFNTNQEENEKI